MATYYVDASVASSGDGSESTPWKYVTDVDFASLVAGDIIKVDKNTVQTIPSRFTDSSTGAADNYIQWLSCDKNDSWNESPGAKIDGQSSIDYTMYVTGGYKYIAGFEFANPTQFGWLSNNVPGILLKNCISSNSGGTGIRLPSNGKAQNCSVHNASGSGFGSLGGIVFLYDCLSQGCGGDGIRPSSSLVALRCAVYDCTNNGIRTINTSSVMNCTISSCGVGITHASGYGVEYFQNVVRECPTGYEINTDVCLDDNVYYDSAGTGTALSILGGHNLCEEVTIATDDPVVDASSDNYSTSSNNPIYGKQVVAGANWNSQTTYSYVTAGLPPEITSGGGTTVKTVSGPYRRGAYR